MDRMKFALFAALLFAWTLSAAETIASSRAKDHIGETGTVCGKVASTRYLDASNRQPTFLNFDKPFPDHTFTAIIFGENRAKFGKPEQDYLQKDVCVTGKIINYNDKPEIELADPKQIRLDSK